MSERKTYTCGDHRRKMARRRKARETWFRGLERHKELIQEGHSPLCSIHYDHTGCLCGEVKHDGGTDV